MKGKTRIKSLILIFLVLFTVSSVFIWQNQTHVDEIAKIRKNNDIKVTMIKNQFKLEKETLENEINAINKVVEKMDSIILEKESRIMELNWNIEKMENLLGVKKTIANSTNFTVTAYDLSYQSCNKLVSDRAYGITKTGKSLKGLDLRTASTISTDPRVIPLGSIVYLSFVNENVKKYNGLYISNDTGSAIKGNKIDLFFGDSNSTKNALNFGIQKAKVILLQ